MKRSSIGVVLAAAVGVVTWQVDAELKAADVMAYGVMKGARVMQFSAGAPFELTAQGMFSAYVASGVAEGVAGVQVAFPQGAGDAFLDAVTPTLWEFEDSPGAPSELDEYYPNGNYEVTMEGMNDGTVSVTLPLAAGTLPGAPTVANYSALQNINPSAPLVVSWSAFGGATANDFVVVRMDGTEQGLAYVSPLPGAPGALAGTATSVTIPAGVLDPNQILFLSVRFVKVTKKDTASYAGAVGVAGLFKETQVMVKTGAGSGGGDTTPPVFLTSAPADKATNVPVNATISFTFNEEMSPVQAIAWGGNLQSQNFAYAWSEDGRTLHCDYMGLFPTNLLVTWKLNPTGAVTPFADAAGNRLASETYSGQFTTSPTACGIDEEDSGLGAFSLNHQVEYVQVGNGTPTPKLPSPAMLTAALTSPTNNPVTRATLNKPGGASATLTNFFGRSFFNFGEYATQTAMDADWPAGTYTLNLERQDGGKPTATVTVPADPYPPVPQLLNLLEAQNLDPAQDFEFRWNGIPGATAKDSLMFMLAEGTFVFMAPDECVPRPLPNTATSMVVPKGTLQPGKSYEGSLMFFRGGGQNSASIADIPLMTSGARLLSFTVTTRSGQPAKQPRFTGYRRLADGKFELTLEGEASKTHVLEAATSLGGWSNLSSQVAPANGIMTFIDDRVGPNVMFYRAKVQ